MVKKVIDISSDRAGGISMTFLKMNKRKVLANKEARPESHSCHLLYSNEQNRRIFRDSPSARRGVAQPGSAPGSGPGGRRFKSSRPDHSFQEVTSDSWLFSYIAVDNFVDRDVTVYAFGSLVAEFTYERLREIAGTIPSHAGNIPRSSESRTIVRSRLEGRFRCWDGEFRLRRCGPSLVSPTYTIPSFKVSTQCRS